MAKKPVEEKKEKNEENSEGDIVLKIRMHCEGCANKVSKSLRGFDGVEEVVTDCANHKVIVKGEKADSLEVLERIKKKCGKHVELLSPMPKPRDLKQQNKEELKVMMVMLKVYMHCQSCAQEIKKTMLKMKGVRTVEPDAKKSTVMVKGVFDPSKLVDYLHNRAGKHAVILKQHQEDKDGKKCEIKEGIEEDPENETDSNFFYYHSQYPFYDTYSYQIFSEESTHSCSIL